MNRSPPVVDLLFQGGTFEDAKSTCRTQNLWLLVNLLSSKTESASLNRDLWSNDTVSEAVMSSFVLWQVYDDTIEGKRISTLYRTGSAPPPVVLLIDPVTGQKMEMWSGVIQPQSFVEDLSCFSEADTDQTCSDTDQVPVPSCGQELEETWSPSNNDDDDVVDGPRGHLVDIPDLTEEPKVDCDESLVCSLCVRVPDGRRKQRRFLKTEPFQLLWSLCVSLLEESEIEYNAFKAVLAIPGDSKTLHYGLYANTTFEESGLANSLISVLLR